MAGRLGQYAVSSKRLHAPAQCRVQSVLICRGHNELKREDIGRDTQAVGAQKAGWDDCRLTVARTKSAGIYGFLHLAAAAALR